jgi:dienelactone hydrolase
MRSILLISCCILLYAFTVQGAVQGIEVVYPAGDTTLKGYLAFDDSIQGKRPGILVVHEWWGHNAYARKRADMLAEMGYTALALDMYGNGKTASHPQDAAKFSGEIKKNMPLAQERFEAAMKLLQKELTVDKEKISAIGYCFGGAIVLEMARSGLDLDGVASFHGSLTTTNPARPGMVKAKVLALNGEDDPFVKAEEIEAFKKEMEAAGISYRFINYPGAKHSFTNPDADKFGEEFDLPLAYSPEADRMSWMAMLEFFREIYN